MIFICVTFQKLYSLMGVRENVRLPEWSRSTTRHFLPAQTAHKPRFWPVWTGRKCMWTETSSTCLELSRKARQVQRRDSESYKNRRRFELVHLQSNCSWSCINCMDGSRPTDCGAHLEDTPLSVKRTKTVQVGLSWTLAQLSIQRTLFNCN